MRLVESELNLSIPGLVLVSKHTATTHYKRMCMKLQGEKQENW